MSVSNLALKQVQPEVICGDPGMGCHVIVRDSPKGSAGASDRDEWAVAVPKHRVAAHDEVLAKLTEDFNRLFEPFRQPRSDGKRLRLITLESGESVFVWATCRGTEGGGGTAGSLGSIDEQRAAVGLI